ncbi:MAG: hypothetical protein GYB68_01590 [Chloroflexi bacterium]|nr:hypothetical protein [Chloroflexota bacterium]
MPTRQSAKPKGQQSGKARRRTTSGPTRSAWYVPWWAFGLVILIVAGATCGTWSFILSNRGVAESGLIPTPTPIIVVITSTPTLSAAGAEESPAAEEATAAPLPTETPLSFPEASPTSPQLSQIIEIGSRIIIEGTGGQGLAVRQGPGLTYTFFFVGNDGDLFDVQDGPREGDGFIWWYITDPNDADRAGWAAETYLQVVGQN